MCIMQVSLTSHQSTTPKPERLITMRLGDFFAGLILLGLIFSSGSASDPSPLNDFCVADNKNPLNSVFPSGKPCKDRNLVKATDFTFKGLKIPGNTNNSLGALVTPAFVEEFPGLNTLGVAIARIDYAPKGGSNPPHVHPRGTEILTVLEGTLYVGFVTSNPNNTVYSTILQKGEVFVFPVGLVHFQLNVGDAHAAALAAFNSNNPGVYTVANTIFGSKPPINAGLLAKAFQLGYKEVEELQSKVWFDDINFYP